MPYLRLFQHFNKKWHRVDIAGASVMVSTAGILVDVAMFHLALDSVLVERVALIIKLAYQWGRGCVPCFI